MTGEGRGFLQHKTPGTLNAKPPTGGVGTSQVFRTFLGLISPSSTFQIDKYPFGKSHPNLDQMAIKVLPAEDADMPRIFDIACDAFARNEPIWDVFWPEHWTESGRKQGSERMTKTKNSDPSANYLKAVDDSTGEIVGMAKWFIFKDMSDFTRKTEGSNGDYWHSEDEKKYAAQIGRLFLVERKAAVERNDGKLLSLDALTVDPKHQRKGVGEALVRWGTEKADELGFEAVVESSVFGRGLYEKCGFVFQKNVHVQVPGETDRPTGSFAWLVRPKKTL